METKAQRRGDLFSPLTVGPLAFKNRAVLAPAVINSAHEDGSVSPAYHDFYLARARAGVGYIVLGGVFVHERGRGFNRQLGIHEDALVPGLARLAQAVKEHCALGAQLSYKCVGRLPETFSLRDIAEVRAAFVHAARRAQACGFDAIELHACHDYLLNFFLSPYFNHRGDSYGGSLENRFRLLQETVEEVRGQMGAGLALGVRLSLTDFMDQGLGLEETLEVARRLQGLKVDYLSASVGIGLTQFRMSPPLDVPRSTELALARACQQAVGIPVIGVGRLDRPDNFRAAVEEGHVLLAGAVRAFIADPEFAVKIKEGRQAEIRPCLACNYCLACLQRGEPVSCVVNPWVGRDLAQLKPLSRPIEVTVVGGGPAGLTAAAAAARRGARVRLFEQASEPGGNLRVATLPPFKEPLRDLAEYLAAEARRAGVEILCGRQISAADLAREDVEAIILATGSRPLVPAIEGLKGPRTILAEEVLRQPAPAAGHFLVVGGGLVGLETAEHLCQKSALVTVIEMLPQIGQGMVPMRLALLKDRLLKAGVNILTRTKLLSWQDGLARVETGAATVELGPFDMLVVAAGYASEDSLAKALPLGVRVEIIGDALKPRSVLEAVKEGLDRALALA